MAATKLSHRNSANKKSIEPRKPSQVKPAGVLEPSSPVIEQGMKCRAIAVGMFPEAFAVGTHSHAFADITEETHHMALAMAKGVYAVAEARGVWATSVTVGTSSRSIVYGDGNYAVAIGCAPEAYALGNGGTAIAIVSGDDNPILSAGPDGRLIVVLADLHRKARRVFEAAIGDRHIFPHRPYTIDRTTGEFYEIRPGDQEYDYSIHPESPLGKPEVVRKMDAELLLSYDDVVEQACGKRPVH